MTETLEQQYRKKTGYETRPGDGYYRDCYTPGYGKWLESNIALLTAENKRLREEQDELMEMIRIIPCTCHEGFKTRNLTDPACPRCNWIYEDLIIRIRGGNNAD